MSTFDDALATLPAPLRAQVEGCFEAWAADDKWRQIAVNIRCECALESSLVGSLLLRFAEQLAASPADTADTTGRDEWCSACQSFELRGIEVPTALRPAKLGRAWRVASFASSISEASDHQLTREQAAREIRKYAGKLPPARWEEQARAGKLGFGVTWATFHPVDGTQDPFSCIPETAAAVCCALGLGCHPVAMDILVLTYSTAAPAHGLPLHRPTVADANSYSFYRPHADRAAYHGYTAPLALNPDDLKGMPEVVHAQVSGAALILPYRIFV
jgi:hypothetical protein